MPLIKETPSLSVQALALWAAQDGNAERRSEIRCCRIEAKVEEGRCPYTEEISQVWISY